MKFLKDISKMLQRNKAKHEQRRESSFTGLFLRRENKEYNDLSLGIKSRLHRQAKSTLTHSPHKMCRPVRPIMVNGRALKWRA